jgi:hypothetical protein
MRRIETEQEPEGYEVVLATQHARHFTIDLWSANAERLVDTSLAMQLPPGARREGAYGIDMSGLASGSYTFGFEAGGTTFSESIEILNEAEAITLWKAPATIPRKPVTPGALEYVCFMATSGGRYITGLRWQHTIDGVPAEIIYSHGCVLAETDQPSGAPVTFTASAGGRSLTVQIPAR